jgi:plastocyanin
MSRSAKGGLLGGATLAAAAVLALLALGGRTGPTTSATREIVLDARDVAFNEINPQIVLRPGERVRFVVRNGDPGVLHSISLPGIDSTVRDVLPGQEITFEVTVPDAGRFEYVCPQHMPRMRGSIEVRPASPAQP